MVTNKDDAEVDLIIIYYSREGYLQIPGTKQIHHHNIVCCFSTKPPTIVNCCAYLSWVRSFDLRKYLQRTNKELHQHRKTILDKRNSVSSSQNFVELRLKV